VLEHPDAAPGLRCPHALEAVSPTCETIFANTKTLRRHLGVFHGPATTLACAHCPFVCKQSHKLKAHIGREHPDVAAALGQSGYPCDHPGCSAWFLKRKNLERHQDTHKASDFPRFVAMGTGLPLGPPRSRPRATSGRGTWVCQAKVEVEPEPEAEPEAKAEPEACVGVGICGQRFLTQQGLQRHHQRTHGRPGDFVAKRARAIIVRDRCQTTDLVRTHLVACNTCGFLVGGAEGALTRAQAVHKAKVHADADTTWTQCRGFVWVCPNWWCEFFATKPQPRHVAVCEKARPSLIVPRAGAGGPGPGPAPDLCPPHIVAELLKCPQEGCGNCQKTHRQAVHHQLVSHGGAVTSFGHYMQFDSSGDTGGGAEMEEEEEEEGGGDGPYEGMEWGREVSGADDDGDGEECYEYHDDEEA